MQVKDLIKNTSWRPHAENDKFCPIVSIILPTFRRAKDGLLGRVIESFSSQTLADIELIIVDDASTDGSADIIRRAMQKDGRISCLTHQSNIGLPAVSEFEGYCKAKGRFIGFAFDDFVFAPDAFEKLLRVAQNGAPTHGYIHANVDGEEAVYGKDSVAADELMYRNTIGNSSVLLPKQVIEDVGLFDPHVALVRHCDWDLWRRIHKRYQFQKADVFVGYEHGTARTDSLGATYPAFFEAVPEFMSIPRDERLRPENFSERDILSAPDRASGLLNDHIEQAAQFFYSKSWAKHLGKPPAEPATKPVIGIYSHVSPSTSLCFDGILNSVEASMLYMLPLPECWARTMQLLRCDAVIFVRDLLQPQFFTAVQECRKYNIPHYFLSDDNYSLLVKEYDVLSEYTPARLQKELSSFEGVLVSSEQLKIFYREQKIHEKVQLFSAIIDQSLLKKCAQLSPKHHPENELRFGFMGGGFRMQSLIEDVLPALSKIAQNKKVSIYVRGHQRDYPTHYKNIEIIGMGVIANWHDFICTWRQLGLHAIIHPIGRTANIDYKTANAILVSYYLGAIPVVNEEKAYIGIGSDQGLLKIGNSPSAWDSALNKIANQSFRTEMLTRLESLCNKHFNIDQNLKVIKDISSNLHSFRSTREIRLRSSLSYVYDQYSKFAQAHVGHAATVAMLNTQIEDHRLDAENTRLAEISVRQLWSDSLIAQGHAEQKAESLENELIELKNRPSSNSGTAFHFNFNISGSPIDEKNSNTNATELMKANDQILEQSQKLGLAIKVEEELRIELAKVHADCKSVIHERNILISEHSKAMDDIKELGSELEKVHADCRIVIRERDEMSKAIETMKLKP